MLKKIRTLGVLLIAALLLSGCKKADLTDYLPNKAQRTAKRVIYVDTSAYRSESEKTVLSGKSEAPAAVTETAKADMVDDRIEEIRTEAIRLCAKVSENAQGIDIDGLLLTIGTEEMFMMADENSIITIDPFTLPLAGAESGEEVIKEQEYVDELAEKLEELKAEFPDGAYWNYGGVTDVPCRHEHLKSYSCNVYGGKTSAFFGKNPGKQCLGFASMISDRLFGEDAEIYEIYDFDDLQVGDHIRFAVGDGYHSLIVIEKTEDEVSVVECNCDFETCMISWGEMYSEDYLSEHGARFTSRYADR